ncbi:MAG: hypothetical protein JWQ88_3710 [Rhodoferax sp.]|nr:hypothetical protein [Rhodoferax sp.]
MNSGEIARIVGRVRETANRQRLCATFQVASHSDRWLQYGDDRVNAAYPSSHAPDAIVQNLGGTLECWEAMRYMTVVFHLEDDLAIALWIEGYLDLVLASQGDQVDLKLAPFKTRAGA